MENTLFLRGLMALEESDALLGNTLPKHTNTDNLGPMDQTLVPGMGDDEGAGTDAGLDEMIATTMALEEIRQSLSRMPISKPMSKNVAGALEIAIEHMCDRVGLERRTYLALEQFDLGRPARTQATRGAMEGLGNAIKNLIVKILAWIKRSSRVAFDSMVDSFQGANKYVEKAKELEELALSVKTAHGNNRIPGSIKNKSIATFFGHHADARAIFQDYEKYNHEFNETFSGQILAGAISQLASMGQDVLKYNATGAFGGEQAASAADRTIRWLQANSFKRFVPPSATGSVFDNMGHDGEAGVYALPFGDIGFLVDYTQQHDRFVGIAFKPVKMTDGEGPTTVKVLTPEEVMGLAKAMDVNGRRGLFKDFVKIKTQLHDVSKTLDHICETIGRQQAQNTSGAVVSLHFFKLIAEALMDLTKRAYQYNTLVHGNLIKYCTASMKMYEALPEITHQHKQVTHDA